MILLSILLIALFVAGLWLALTHLGMAADSPLLLAHITSAIAAYAAFAAAVVCAWMFMRHERSLKKNLAALPSIPLLTLERWMFGFVYSGFILLSVSLVVGGWAGGAGFVLKPHHKTIFALLAWLCFVVLIAGRVLLGWRGAKAVRMVHFGSAFLLLAYVGTHFVLRVILQRGAT
ncbi:MAG: cytochrome c biogenesis protein CcsA [Cytophagales bacterium]|nr:cytochrome c biogenesis protein CcsA [Cytophagales bacterium]